MKISKETKIYTRKKDKRKSVAYANCVNIISCFRNKFLYYCSILRRNMFRVTLYCTDNSLLSNTKLCPCPRRILDNRPADICNATLSEVISIQPI